MTVSDDPIVTLSARSSYRIGGPARRFVEPESRAELIEAVEHGRSLGLPVFLVGGGTNLLFDDAPLEALVCSTRKLRGVSVIEPGRLVEFEPGVPMTRAIRFALSERGWGLEGFVGIPGTIGGAVFGNAGGARGWIDQVVDSVEIFDSKGEVRWVSGTDVPWSYRSSGLDGCALLRARIRLEPGDPTEIRKRTREVFLRKERTQPLNARSAGCVFRNPDGDSAGRLIEAAGLKGTRVGGAVVSDVHANFIVNEHHATAADVRALAEIVRARVRDQFGVTLFREVGGPGWRSRSTVGDGVTEEGATAEAESHTRGDAVGNVVVRRARPDKRPSRQEPTPRSTESSTSQRIHEPNGEATA